MKAWLIYEKRDAKKNQSFIEMHQKSGRELGMEIQLIYAEELSIVVEQSGLQLWYQGKRKEKPDFALHRARNYILARQLEGMGVPVYNNSRVALAGNHKGIAYQEVSSLSIPVVETCICKQEHLPKKLLRLPADQGGRLVKPVVVKAVSGHGGSQVFLYENREQLEAVISGLGRDDAVIQPLISGPGEDIRVYVVGNRIKGCVLRRAEGDFRANFSLGGSIFPYKLTKKEESLVEKILGHWYFDFAGIDFIRDGAGRLLFNEIEDAVGSRMYYQCYEEDILFSYLKYLKYIRTAL